LGDHELGAVWRACGGLDSGVDWQGAAVRRPHGDKKALDAAAKLSTPWCLHDLRRRWRRAHGIGPRRPAQRPWLTLGISRSTWYRRRKKEREQAALAARNAVLDRLEWQLAELRGHLDRCAAAQAVMASLLY
jgi:hypothetical protein